VTPPRPKSTRAPLADESTVRSWLSVVRAYNLCDALMTRRFAALGVRTAEHEILANLRRDPGLSQQALAARCFTAKSSLSGVITDLEQRGWVRREPDPADARAKRLSLTAEGARVAERTARAQAEVVATMATVMTTTQLEQVHAAMAAVSERLQQALDADD
jgi:DNA-binding MarR family transcriptional regulator